MEEQKKKNYKPIIYLSVIGVLLIVCGYLYSTGYFDYYKQLLGIKTNTQTTEKSNNTTNNNTNKETTKTNKLLEDATVKLLYSNITENKNDDATYTMLKSNLTSITALDENTIHAIAYKKLDETKIKYSQTTCKVHIDTDNYNAAIQTVFGTGITLKNTDVFKFYISTEKLKDCGNYLTVKYDTTKKLYVGQVTKKEVPTTFVLSKLTDADKTSITMETDDNTTTNTTSSINQTKENTLTLTESYVVVKYTYDATKKTYTYNVYKDFTSQIPIETKKDVTSIDNLVFDTYAKKASKVMYTFKETTTNKYNLVSSKLGE